MDQAKLLAAVNQLDGKNDDHWTSDGLPRIETVRELAEDPSISRADIDAAAPDVRRPKDEDGVPPVPPVPPVPDAPPAPVTAEDPPTPPETENPEEPEKSDEEVPLAPSLDRGDPGDPKALKKLRKQLEEAEDRSDELRRISDEVAAELAEASAEESRLRAEIEAASPRTGQMQAIQDYFKSQDRRTEALLSGTDG